MEDNYKSVFECNPGAQEIYVVDGMPFLEAGHAQGHSITTGKPVETVKRPVAAKKSLTGDAPTEGDTGENPAKPTAEKAKKPRGKKAKTQQ